MNQLTRLAGAIALAASASLAFAADPIKIGVDGPFTGGSSSMGVSMRDGVRLATDEINKAGGVLGRLLRARSSAMAKSKNERGVQIAQELINKEKVVATVGYINADTSPWPRSRFLAGKAKIPVMNNVAPPAQVITHQFDYNQPENYVFRNAARDSIQAPMIVEEAIVHTQLQEAGDPGSTPPTTASSAAKTLGEGAGAVR